jgi:hypothetical protein
VKRKKQNPIDDLGKNVGGWLGGAARTFADLTDSSRDNAPRAKGTQKFIEGSRMIGRTADALTGGFGSAALKDARKGSSVPSNLLKTAAVNLAVGAAGTLAAQGVSKVAGRVVAGRITKATTAITPRKQKNLIFHAGSDAAAKNQLDPNYNPVHKRFGNQNIHMGEEGAAYSRQETRIGFDKEADIPLANKSTIDRYEIINRRTVSRKKYLDRVDAENNLSPKRQQMYVQYYDKIPTPNNKILKYENLIESMYSTSYLVPKSRIDSGDVVYRGTKSYLDLDDASYTSPQLNRLRNVQQEILANRNNIRSAGAVSGVVFPKNKRNSNKNRR